VGKRKAKKKRKSKRKEGCKGLKGGITRLFSRKGIPSVMKDRPLEIARAGRIEPQPGGPPLGRSKKESVLQQEGKKIARVRDVSLPVRRKLAGANAPGEKNPSKGGERRRKKENVKEGGDLFSMLGEKRL